MSRADELADRLDDEFVQGRISNHTGRQSAAELRRLSAVSAELLGALKNLVARIEANGGIGAYKDGPVFVMRDARAAIQKAES